MVAAYPMEFPGILTRAKESRPVITPMAFAHQAYIGGNELLLVANGTGRVRASEAVDRALQLFPAEAVVSTGFCGGLRPEMKVADLVLATSVTSNRQEFPTWPVAVPDGRLVHRGSVCTVDHIVQSAEEKSRLAATGAAAVDMEAAAVAERTSAHGLPFSCVKAISDLAGETLLNDFNRALRKDGYFDTIILLRGALRQPWARIRELIRLRERCVRAAGALGEFFVDLRF